jgi:hypothetical protein
MTSSPALTDNGTAVSGNGSSTSGFSQTLIGYLWARATFTKRA